MNASSRPEERVKVWRPQGFAGLEVEKLGLFEIDVPKLVVPTFDLTVVVRSAGRNVSNIGGAAHEMTGVNEARLYTNNTEHRWSAESEPGAFIDVWSLKFSEACLAHFMAELTGSPALPYFPRYEVDAEVNAPLARLVQDAIDTFDRPATTMEREAKLLGLLYATLKHCSTKAPPDLEVGREPRAVAVVKDALQSAPEVDVKLDDLAALTGLNKFYLNRVFSKEVGVSPHQYQLGLKVQRAKDKLAKGEEIANVAFDLGFSDQAHLTRTFKRITLTTPGRFQMHTLPS